MASSRKNWSTGKVRPGREQRKDQKGASGSGACLSSVSTCTFPGRFAVPGPTRYVDGVAVVEVLGEEVGVERGAHQDDLHVGPVHHQVLEHQHQEVTGKQNGNKPP